MTRKRLLLLSLLLLVFVLFSIGLFLLPKCQSQKPLFRVASNIWPGYEMLYLAKSLGYYENLPIRFVEVPSTSMVLRGLRNGTLEAGCVTLDEAISLLQDSIDIKVILVFDESRGGDVIMAKPEIKSLKELRGKRIGLENSTVSAILLDAALVEANIKIEDVTLVPMSISEHLQGYLNGKVDAVATFEPVKSQLIDKNAKILFSSEKIPGRILDILVVRTEIIANYSNELTALLHGYFQALNYFKRNPTNASKIMEKRLGKNVLNQFNGLYFPTLTDNYNYLKGDNPRLNSSTNALISIMLKRNLLRKNVSFKYFAEPKFLPKE
jgi:NitT/TauT family transport system substrate-binding protein